MNAAGVTDAHVLAMRNNTSGAFHSPSDAPKPVAVYRVFDHDGDLLYVGCSMAPLSRVYAHAVTKMWFHLASSVTIQHYRSVAEATAAEQAAIAAERPRYNIVSQRGWKPGESTDYSTRFLSWDELDAAVSETQA